MNTSWSSPQLETGLRQLARSLLISLGVAHAAGAQCTPAWDDVFASPGTIGNGINAVCVWDDGTGPAVYLGGDFASIGNIQSSGFPQPNLTGAHSIVKVTPTGYQALGAGIGPSSTAQVGTFGNARVIRAMTPYDPDGAGPMPSMLYAAGAFYYASTSGTTQSAQRWSIAAWDGTSWNRVGPEFAPGLEFGDLNLGFPIQFNVRAMTVYDPDLGGPMPPELFVGGAFPSAGGVFSQGLARWNGTNWSDVGGPFSSASNVVYALAVVDEDSAGPLPPVLYAAGRITTMGDGTGVTGLARWNGTTWSAVPGVEPAEPANPNIDGITALAVQRVGGGEVLWVGGNLLVNGSPCGVARLNNGTWECVYTDGDARGGTIADDSFGLPMTVQRIAQYGDDMYFFGPPGGPSYTPCVLGSFRGGMYKWNAASAMTSWVGDIDALTHTLGTVGTGDRLTIGAMTSIDFDLAGPGGEKLFIGGNFNVIAGATRTDMTLFNGSSFEAIAPHASATLGLVGSLGQEDGRRLYSFDFDQSGPAPRSLVISGRFHGAGGVVSPNVIGFTGSSFFSMPIGASAAFCDGTDFNGSPAFLDFASFDDGSGERLYAATTNGVLVWSGTEWQQFAAAPGIVRELTVFNDGTGSALWALGQFSSIGGVAANGSAKWNGTTWQRTDIGYAVAATPASVFLDSAQVVDLGTGSMLLVSGTDYTNDDALGESFVEVFTAGQWITFAGVPAFGSIQGIINDSVVFNGQVFLCGAFSQLNGAAASAKVIRWSAGQWLDTGVISGFPAALRLVVHDDSNGAALYAITQGSAGTVNKWDGTSTWSSVSTGTIPNMESVASFSDQTGTALYVAHASFLAAGKWAVGIARFRSPCLTCPADFNGSGSVTVQDIFDFLAAYFVGAASADFNASGSVTVQDIFDFLVAYFAGCA